MSNLKAIDGVCINLDLVYDISVTSARDGKDVRITFSFVILDGEGSLYRNGKIFYKTVEEAQDRIKQILQNQNSEDIKI